MRPNISFTLSEVEGTSVSLCAQASYERFGDRLEDYVGQKKVDFYYPTRSTFSIHNAREKCMRARLKTISASYAGL